MKNNEYEEYPEPIEESDPKYWYKRERDEKAWLDGWFCSGSEELKEDEVMEKNDEYYRNEIDRFMREYYATRLDEAYINAADISFHWPDKWRIEFLFRLLGKSFNQRC